MFTSDIQYIPTDKSVTPYTLKYNTDPHLSEDNAASDLMNIYFDKNIFGTAFVGDTRLSTAFSTVMLTGYTDTGYVRAIIPYEDHAGTQRLYFVTNKNIYEYYNGALSLATPIVPICLCGTAWTTDHADMTTAPETVEVKRGSSTSFTAGANITASGSDVALSTLTYSPVQKNDEDADILHFWIKSTETIAANSISLYLADASAAHDVEHVIDVELTADTWTQVIVDPFDASALTDFTTVALVLKDGGTVVNTTVLYLDDIYLTQELSGTDDDPVHYTTIRAYDDGFVSTTNTVLVIANGNNRMMYIEGGHRARYYSFTTGSLSTTSIAGCLDWSSHLFIWGIGDALNQYALSDPYSPNEITWIDAAQLLLYPGEIKQIVPHESGVMIATTENLVMGYYTGPPYYLNTSRKISNEGTRSGKCICTSIAGTFYFGTQNVMIFAGQEGKIISLDINDYLYKRINDAEANKSFACVDPVAHEYRLYVPLDEATEPSHCFIYNWIMKSWTIEESTTTAASLAAIVNVTTIDELTTFYDANTTIAELTGYRIKDLSSDDSLKRLYEYDKDIVLSVLDKSVKTTASDFLSSREFILRGFGQNYMLSGVVGSFRGTVAIVDFYCGNELLDSYSNTLASETEFNEYRFWTTIARDKITVKFRSPADNWYECRGFNLMVLPYGNQ